MSGLAIVSGIALSIGTPVSSDVVVSAARMQIIEQVRITDRDPKPAPAQMAGLSQWFWQLVSPPKGEKYERIQIDRPYRY